MYPYTLLVIDMQYKFPAARNVRLRQACRREITEAMTDRAHIIFVEYVNYGRTIKSLRDLVTHYKEVSYVTKCSDNGAHALRPFLTGSPKCDVRVCGVNTNCCVLDTVRGLKRSRWWNARRSRRRFIHVVADACNSWSSSSHDAGLKRFKRMSNVLIRHDVQE